MFKQGRSLVLIATAVVVLALFASSTGIFPVSAKSGITSTDASAQASGIIPTLVFPTSTIPISKIIYIWTAVDNATKYQVQVYQGSTRIAGGIYSATVCSSGTCSIRPGALLSNGTYQWRVRAYVNGQFRAFSEWQGFVVLVPPANGFYSPFTTDANGWQTRLGTWQLEGANYYVTTGIADKAVTIGYANDYSTLTYEAKMKRSGCVGCANVLAIRGNPDLDSTGWWKTEYTFDYTNSGLFSVWKDNNGSYTALKNWTSSSAIKKNDWNVLKVTAKGSQLKFYINDVLVWSGTDSAYSSGRVGIGMYRSKTSTGDKLWVDWAKLTTTVAADTMMDVLDTGVEVGGGNRNIAP